MRAVRRAAPVVALAAALLAASPAALAAPTVTLDPTTAPSSGQLITVHVAGCKPGQPIAIVSTAAAGRTATVNADGSGNATTSVASSTTPGTFTVSATCGDTTTSARSTVVAPPARAETGLPRPGRPNVTVIGIGSAVALVVLAAAGLLVRRRRALAGTII